MKSFWQAAVGGHSAGVVLKPEHCPSLSISQQSAQSTTTCKVFINILLSYNVRPVATSVGFDHCNCLIPILLWHLCIQELARIESPCNQLVS